MTGERYRVAPSTYRGEQGWQVNRLGHPGNRVFFVHESAARRFIAALRAGGTWQDTRPDFRALEEVQP